MKLLSSFVLLAAILAIAGCSDTSRDPISGEECSPNNPVIDMDASDCSATPAAQTV